MATLVMMSDNPNTVNNVIKPIVNILFAILPIRSRSNQAQVRLRRIAENVGIIAPMSTRDWHAPPSRSSVQLTLTTIMRPLPSKPTAYTVAAQWTVLSRVNDYGQRFPPDIRFPVLLPTRRSRDHVMFFEGAYTGKHC